MHFHLDQDTAESAKVMKHVQGYADFFTTVTSRKAAPDDLISMSEAVYKRNLQCFNSRTMTSDPADLPEFTINKESLTIPCHIDKG